MTLLNFCPPSFISSGRADGHSGANHSPQFIPLAVVNYCAKLFLLAFFYVDQIENIVPWTYICQKNLYEGWDRRLNSWTFVLPKLFQSPTIALCLLISQNCNDKKSMEMLIAPWSGITLKEMLRLGQKLSSARPSIITRRGRKSSGIETILSPNWVTKSAISRMIPLRVVLVMPLCFSFVRSQFMSDLGQIASHVGMAITLSHRLYAKTSSDARTHNKNHLFISACPFVGTYV